MDWQAQKMNIITGVIVVVIGGMVAYKMGVFGGGDTASAKPPATAAAFATPATPTPRPIAQTSATPPPAPMPVATAPNPAKHATGTASESENTAIQNNPPAAISMDTQNGTSATSGVTPLSSTPESASSTATVQTGKTVPVAVLHAMQAELVQMQGEIQTLSTAMGRMDSRTVIAERHLQQHLHQMDQKAHNPFARAAITTHSEIAGYRLQSIGETEAWLSNPDGKTVIASAGTHLPGLTILAVAPEGVKTSEGWLGF